MILNTNLIHLLSLIHMKITSKKERKCVYADKSSKTPVGNIGVNVTGPRRWQFLTDVPCNIRSGTLKNPPYSMAMSAEHKSNICSPSPVLVTSLYEWKILEWDEQMKRNIVEPKKYLPTCTWRVVMSEFRINNLI